MLTNAHLLESKGAGRARRTKGSYSLRVRVETMVGCHSWHDASVLSVFTGEQTKLGPMASSLPLSLTVESGRCRASSDRAAHLKSPSDKGCCNSRRVGD